MNLSFKIISQKLSDLLVLILCMQMISFDLHGNQAEANQSIENFELEKNFDQLLLLIQKRLVIMHEVTRAKWNHNLPIEDKVREQHILIDLTEKTKQYQLNENWVTQFFQTQIDAAKEIQKRDFALWQTKKIIKFEKVFSLKKDLRFYIDQINQEMLFLLIQINKRNLDTINLLILEQPISKRETDFIENDIWQLAVSPFKTI